MRVGIKFCGNCNPVLDTVELARALAGASEIEFVHWEGFEYDALLILSGCAVDCASRPDFRGPTVIVAGNHINRVPRPLEDLLDGILVALNQAINHPV